MSYGERKRKGLERRAWQRTAAGHSYFGVGLGSRRTALVTLDAEGDGRGGDGAGAARVGSWEAVPLAVRERRRSKPVGVKTPEKDSRRTRGSERSLGGDETPGSSSYRQCVPSLNKHLSGVDGSLSGVRGPRVGPGRMPPDSQGPGWSG